MKEIYTFYTSDKKPQSQKSFLIRFWREESGSPWRVTLRSIEDDRPLHFPDLDSFQTELQKLLDNNQT